MPRILFAQDDEELIDTIQDRFRYERRKMNEALDEDPDERQLPRDIAAAHRLINVLEGEGWRIVKEDMYGGPARDD